MLIETVCWELFMTSAIGETAGISPHEAVLLAQAILKQVNTTKLLKSTEDNDAAAQCLLKCYNEMVTNIPGAENEVIADTQITPATTPTAAFKQQIRQGQTIFAAPGDISPASAEHYNSDVANEFRHK